MELVEIIRGAQDAMDRGDYRLSVAACRHVLDTFPSSLTAHRMLGESLLELGETDLAIEHFQRAIAVDPLNVVARLGLGVASEEKRDMNQAYSAYLHAWEINPALDQVRDELVRLRGLLGGGERLHPTRAGLAGIFARGGQFGRAAAEWRAVLMAEPDSRRARTSLAEVHWRSGDDSAALSSSRDALTHGPENVRALAMIADIETRRGLPSAAEFVERYQFADPAGEIMTLLQDWREELDLSFLRRESAILTDFDFSATPLQDRPPVAAAGTAVVAGLGASQFAAPDLWDSLVQDLKPGDLVLGGVAGVQPDVQPFAWFDDDNAASALNPEPFTLDGINDPPSAVPQPARAVEPDAFSLEFATLGPSAAGGTQPIGQAEPAIEPAVFPTPVPVAAPEPLPTPAAPPKAAKDQFVTAGGGIDLTVGWDDLDRQLKEATPNFESSHEMDALMAQLGVDGLQPFEVADAPFDESAWAPFTDDDLNAPVRAKQPAPAAPPVVPVDVPVQPAPFEEPVIHAERDNGVTDDGWDLDHELLAAIPGQKSSGYTELFRHVDTEFPDDGVNGDEIDPFANPDSAGVPLDFEDLLAVTSRDGTAPLREAYTGAAEIAPFADDTLVDSNWNEVLQAGEEIHTSDSFLSEEPFNFEGFGEAVDAGGLDTFADIDTGLDAVGESDAGSGFNGFFADLGDVQPFSVEESFSTTQSVPADSAVDFTEINDAPFDPSSLAGVLKVPTVAPVVAPALDRVAAPNTGDAEPEAPARVGDTRTTEHTIEVQSFQEPAASAISSQSGGLGIKPGGVAWPAFVNHTSELIDRGFDGGNLFVRLRENKRAASSSGILVIDRSVVELRPAARNLAPPGRAAVQVVPAAEPGLELSGIPRPARPGWMTDEERLDLMAMRVRLIDDEASAMEIAELLEVAVSRGLSDPLALRVLGEAYLKLGKTEQAAAQFRHAMLERRRSR